VQPFSSWIRLTLTFLFVGALSILWILAGIVLLPFRVTRIKLCNYYGKIVGSTVARLFLGCKVNIKNQERLDESLPAIYITNHSSAMDVFIGMWICPVGGCGIAKKEIARVPVFGQLYWLSGHLLIDRSKREKAIAAMAEVANLVRTHRLGIWIWPEGTRSKTGRMLPFKKGFVHLALATKLPLVPVVIHNAHKTWPKGSGRIYPGAIDIEVLPPIDTSHWSVETMAEHVKEAESTFIAALGPDQRPLAEGNEKKEGKEESEEPPIRD
jgi:1-acyl-sn-glycerol-3-phosphate acyltransferase